MTKHDGDHPVFVYSRASARDDTIQLRGAFLEAQHEAVDDVPA